MPNDIEMLTWADHGVAMAHSDPAAPAAADEVTAGNDDDGVAVVLERWFLNPRWPLSTRIYRRISRSRRRSRPAPSMC